jgi:ribosomal protein L34
MASCWLACASRAFHSSVSITSPTYSITNCPHRIGSSARTPQPCDACTRVRVRARSTARPEVRARVKRAHGGLRAPMRDTAAGRAVARRVEQGRAHLAVRLED